MFYFTGYQCVESFLSETGEFIDCSSREKREVIVHLTGRFMIYGCQRHAEELLASMKHFEKIYPTFLVKGQYGTLDHAQL